MRPTRPCTAHVSSCLPVVLSGNLTACPASCACNQGTHGQSHTSAGPPWARSPSRRTSGRSTSSAALQPHSEIPRMSVLPTSFQLPSICQKLPYCLGRVWMPHHRLNQLRRDRHDVCAHQEPLGHVRCLPRGAYDQLSAASCTVHQQPSLVYLFRRLVPHIGHPP